MTETELALLELRLLKAGTPYHVHKGDRHFICTSPYCTNLFSDHSGHAPGQDAAEAEQLYDHGSV
jgi:hypothetical protein